MSSSRCIYAEFEVRMLAVKPREVDWELMPPAAEVGALTNPACLALLFQHSVA